MQLEETIQKCWQTAEDHGFHSVGRTFGDCCSLIHSEVSEAFEAFRHSGAHADYVETDGKPEGTAAEFADVVIRIFDAALEDLKLTADQFCTVIEAKMAYNEHRPYLHGKTM